MARTELDDHLRTTAIKAGAAALDGARAVDVRRDGDRVSAVVLRDADGEFEVECERLVVADGVRSPLGKQLGREWHRDTVYAVAGRAYVDSDACPTTRGSAPTSSCAASRARSCRGYGWVFPLGNGSVNLGAGTLATAKRPAEVAIKPLMQLYADTIRDDFGLSGELRMPTSALLPMGGAVSHVAGRNWALVGDAAALRQPAQRRGHRLRPRERAGSSSRPWSPTTTWRPCGPRCCATTTARRSRSPAGWPGW